MAMMMENEQFAVLLDALQAISMLKHRYWKKIGQALQSTGRSEQALKAWQDWSKNTNYVNEDCNTKKYTDEDCRLEWDKFIPLHSSQKATPDVIYCYAREFGWRPPPGSNTRLTLASMILDAEIVTEKQMPGIYRALLKRCG